MVTIAIEYTRSEAIALISQQLGYEVPTSTFDRWRYALEIRPSDEGFYRTGQVKVLAMLGGYLRRNRNMDDAVAFVNQQIEEAENAE